MTGAAIVRWESVEAIVLAVHGAFDGASAWMLRHEMDDCARSDFVIDLTHAVEACDFAASVLAAWARERRRSKRVRFRPGEAAHTTLLAAHGLELVDGDEANAIALPYGFALPGSPTPAGDPA